MGDLDINRIFVSGCKSNNQAYKKFIYWFCKHYFHCDIHPTTNISPSVHFAHNGLGVVINEDSIIGEDVVIQHHVTIGNSGKGVPHILKGVYVGAHAIILGNIEIGKNVTIGAGAVVTKSVPSGRTIVGNPARVINRIDKDSEK